MASTSDNERRSSAQGNDQLESDGASRRTFLQAAAGLSALGAVSSVGAASNAGFRPSRNARVIPVDDNIAKRAALAADLKVTAARRLQRETLALTQQTVNDDELRYESQDFYASFFKTLPQNDYGEVDPTAYRKLVAACESGAQRDFELIETAPTADRGLANPQGAFALQLTGLDGHATRMPAAPSFRSATTAAEMGEVYWQALTRDVPFLEYDTNADIANAIDDLNQFSATVGPNVGGLVTPGTLFRGSTPGDLNGPYISQLLYQDVPYGPSTIVQRYPVPVSDFMTDVPSCVSIQRGESPAAPAVFDPTLRYLNNNRALGEYVHNDVLFQAYFNAAMILLRYGPDAWDPDHPYRFIDTQGPFTSFGGPFLFQLLTFASNLSLNGAWYQKWCVHRRLRPEAYGLRVHFLMTEGREYDIHPDLVNSRAVADTMSRYGTGLLPMGYPEGSPTHPAYPAGHATIAGACCTILKAFFDESFILPDTVQSNADGTALIPYTGSALTLGGEVNKLAYNVAIGRDAAGVHYRSDGTYGIETGEQQAIALLQDYADACIEPTAGFTLTRFDGTPIRITRRGPLTPATSTFPGQATPTGPQRGESDQRRTFR
ncbi:MAG: vanadium-dependent haloperoxidase [Pseudomonadota bacterium]